MRSSTRTRLRWEIRTDTGEVVSARFMVLAVGPLSNANIPAIEGMESFGGEVYHTAHWPHQGVDFTGQRVGVIGTGSSGIQAIPCIAQQASQLYVFQRSPNYSVPAGNVPLDDDVRHAQKASYPERRRLSMASGGGSPHQPHPLSALDVSEQERREAYEKRWQLGGVLFSKTFPDQMLDARIQRHRPSLLGGEDPRGHRRSAGRGLADPDRPSHRDEANLHRRQLLPDVQPRERRAGQLAGDADRADGLGRGGDLGRLLRPGCAGAGDRLRRDDRVGEQAEHCGTRWRNPERRVGVRPGHLSRAGCARLPERVQRQRPGQPIGLGQHGAAFRVARRLDRRRDRLPRRTRSHSIGSHPIGGRRLDRRMHPPCRGGPYAAGKFVVSGRERCRQAAGIHAVRRRFRRLRSDHRGHRRGRHTKDSTSSRGPSVTPSR